MTLNIWIGHVFILIESETQQRFSKWCSIYKVDGKSPHSIVIPPASTKLKGGYTGITLSVCPSVDRIVSALYLQQYSSDPFHICTSYQATSEGVSRVMPVSKFKNFLRCHCRLQFRMDSFHIWYKWSIAWEGVSHVMTFDHDLYLQGHSALT